MREFIIFPLLMWLFFTGVSSANNEIPSSQIIPIVNGCKDYAFKLADSWKKNGWINYAYKKDIYSPEYFPKIIGYLEINETTISKGKNLPAAIGYNIYRGCKPTIPSRLSRQAGSIGQLGRILENKFHQNNPETYILINEKEIRHFTVEKRNIEK